MTRIGTVAAGFGRASLEKSTSPDQQRLLARLLDLRATARRRSAGTPSDRLDLALSEIYLEATGQPSARKPSSFLSATTQLSNSVKVSEANPAQVSRFDVLALSAPTSIVGSVIDTASQGELRIAGDSEGNFAATARFELTGNAGTSTFSVVAGETVTAVADRVNADVNSTAVYALVDNNSLVLRSTSYGPEAVVEVQLVNIGSDVTVTSNPAQLADVQAVTFARNSDYTLSGLVTQAAEQGRLVYQGGAGGIVNDTATFTLTGDLGETLVTITKDESLVDVAARINASTESSGVVALTSGDDLVLQSVAYGSQADVSVEITDIANTIDVSGVNPVQIESFNVVSFVLSGDQAIDGDVTQVASEAELSHTGFLGRVTSNATFTLTGVLGSAEISVNAFETLTSARDKINDQTSATGVSATVSGDQLLLTSQGVGSAATIAVDVVTGSFAVAGGNGDGTANGMDAEAMINGQSVVAAGNDFSFSDAKGDYEFSVVDGFTGSLDTISVSATIAGQFEITGGDGNGSAVGVDATATINGVNLVGNGNSFTISDGGTFALVFTEEFSGVFDDILVATTDKPFVVTGGDDQGTARGSHGTALINGELIESVRNEFLVSTDTGEFVLQFVDAFVGTFDPLEAAPRTSGAVTPNLFELRTELFRQFDASHIRPSTIRHIQSVVHGSLDNAAGDLAAIGESLLSGNFTTQYGRQSIAQLLLDRR